MDPKALLKYNTQHKKAVLLIRPFCVEKIACQMSCSLIPDATRCGIFKHDGLPLLPSYFFSYFTANTAQQETRHTKTCPRNGLFADARAFGKRVYFAG